MGSGTNTDDYVVRRGDELWNEVARRLGPDATRQEIADETRRWAAANREQLRGNPDHIEPGWRLHAPPPVNAPRDPAPPPAPPAGPAPSDPDANMPPGARGDATNVNFATLDAVKNRFNDLAAAFRNAKTPLGQHHDKAISGAGQFAAQLQPGAVKFLLAWREAFGVCEESAGLIAGNIGKTVVDFKAVDVDASTSITL